MMARGWLEMYTVAAARQKAFHLWNEHLSRFSLEKSLVIRYNLAAESQCGGMLQA